MHYLMNGANLYQASMERRNVKGKKVLWDHDESRYCNKNVETPKATKFNYQSRVCTNLRGIGTICAT